MSKPLPLGVLLPTRNVISALPEHIKAVEAWLDLVEEVVVVDSCSNDGTVDLIQEKLQHPRLQVVSHPPGLYESWNYGIQRIQSKYIYISTIGEQMTREGLVHLVETAEQFQADVVLSRPRFIDNEGKPLADFHWPIHDIVEELAIHEPIALKTEQAVYYAIKFGAHSILGSSASNLYRTEVLQKNPFPIDFGGAGDTAWGILNSARARFAITPREFSSFILDPKYQDIVDDGFPTKVFWLSCKVFTELMKSASNSELDPMRRKLCEAMIESGERLLHEGRPFEKLNQKLQLWADNLQALLATERNRTKDLKRWAEQAEGFLAEERNLSKELKKRIEQTDALLAEERNVSKEINPRVAQTEALLAQERDVAKELHQRIIRTEMVLADERNLTKNLISQIESRLVEERGTVEQLTRRIAQIENLLAEERKSAEQLRQRISENGTSLARERAVSEQLKIQMAEQCKRVQETEALLTQERHQVQQTEKLLAEERDRVQKLKRQWWVRFGRHAGLVDWNKFSP